jgi:hypothetical protein
VSYAFFAPADPDSTTNDARVWTGAFCTETLATVT